MNKKTVLLPLLAGFFVMGFGDIIGTVMNQVKAECASDAERISWLMPIFTYVWFLVISIPTGVLSGRIGRKNSVLVSLAVTVPSSVMVSASATGTSSRAAMRRVESALRVNFMVMTS